MRWNLIFALSLAGLLSSCSTDDSGSARSGGNADAGMIGGVKAWPNNDPELRLVAEEPESATGFAANAFPPPIPDTAWHADAWTTYDCMDCHRDGEADAPVLQHRGMPRRLVTAHCRTCHVLIPGLEPKPQVALP